MTTVASAIGRRWPFIGFLEEELSPRPGRLAAVARIALCCTLVVFFAMLYRIPEPAYAAYIVFFLGRGDQSVTVLTGIVGAVAITLATALTIILYMLDADEPALRLPIMAVTAFLSMFLLRTMTIGPIAFLSGFLLIVTQSIIDVIPSLEMLTRFCLWLWVVVILPDVVTILVNLIAGQSPVVLARRTAFELFDTLSVALRTGERASLAAARAQVLELTALRQRAGKFDRALRPRDALDATLIETLGELFPVAELLPSDLEPRIGALLGEICQSCRKALATDAAPSVQRVDIPEDLLKDLNDETLAVVRAAVTVLNRLAAGLARRPTEHGEPPAKHGGLFVPDAFTNPDHVRFALKTTIAAMAAYIIYTGLDWPGIRTALITCFFVALGSLGETMHKLTLRLSGALIGGLLGGLCLVYVLPWTEDIGDLSLLIAGATAAFAWVATSSERLAYAGMQAALAFYMGVLQEYEPATDLTVLRDRVAGILLGNFLMSLVFSTVWPVSARDQARRALSGAVIKLAALLRSPEAVASGGGLAAAQALANARQMTSIAMFETVTLPSDRGPDNAAFDAIERFGSAVLVVVDQPPADVAGMEYRSEDETVAAWLSAYAETVAAGRAPPALPGSQIRRTPPSESPLAERSALAARAMMRASLAGMVDHAA